MDCALTVRRRVPSLERGGGEGSSGGSRPSTGVRYWAQSGGAVGGVAVAVVPVRSGGAAGGVRAGCREVCIPVVSHWGLSGFGASVVGSDSVRYDHGDCGEEDGPDEWEWDGECGWESVDECEVVGEVDACGEAEQRAEEEDPSEFEFGLFSVRGCVLGRHLLRMDCE